MLVLVMVGPALEAMLGRVRYIALYLLSAIGGGVLVYLVEDRQVLRVWGLGRDLRALRRVLGARPADPAPTPPPSPATIVLNLIISVTFPGISLFGHLGGLITGALVGGVFALAPARRWPLQLAGVVAMAAILVVATLIRTSALT